MTKILKLYKRINRKVAPKTGMITRVIVLANVRQGSKNALVAFNDLINERAN